MQALTMKYHGPTNYRGSRISVTTEAWGRKYYPYSYGADCPFTAAAKEYIAAVGWNDGRTFAVGTLHTGEKVAVLLTDFVTFSVGSGARFKLERIGK